MVRKRRKPFAVWMLLTCGERWMFERHATIADAIATALTLRGQSPLFPHAIVWISHIDKPAHSHHSHFAHRSA